MDTILEVSQTTGFVMRGTHFAKNSTYVVGGMHVLLEFRFAEQRKLLEYPGGWLLIHGYTSPEWSTAPDKETALILNKQLSYERAEAVYRAILASTGGVGEGVIGEGTYYHADGLGADPFDPAKSEAAAAARRSGANPEDGRLWFADPYSPDSPDHVVSMQKSLVYWKMRRVDIGISGIFTIRIKAT